MEEVDPVHYDAIDDVVEDRKDASEWDPDKMRSALIDVARGENQRTVAEDHEFSQGVVSKRWTDVEERAEEIRASRNEGSRLFRDPLEEAIEEFGDFFEEMDENYNMGIRDVAIQMMVDEIRDAQQLPSPMYLQQFLNGANSGVTGQDVEYISRRYKAWLENYKGERTATQGMGGGMDEYGGAAIQENRQQPGGMSGGVDVGYNQSMFPDDGGNQQAQGNSGGNARINRLEQKVERLTEAIEKDHAGGDDSQTVRVEQDDGSIIEVPLDHPMAMQMMSGGDDDDDMLEKLTELKEAGLVLGPEDLREHGDDGGEMADAIAGAIEQMSQRQMQAQQQMSENFSSAIEDIREMQEEEDDALTMTDVQQVIEDTLKEDEVDRLERQLEDMRSSFTKELRDAKRYGSDGIEDPEYLKTDRKMEFQEKQLETINDNLRQLPKEVGVTVREALVPAFKELQHSTPGEGHPLWNPPGGQGQSEPGFVPPTVTEPTQQERQPQRPAPEPDRDRGYPEPEPEPEPEPRTEPESQGMGQQQPERDTAQKGREVREKLGLEDAGDNQQVEA
jgi:hypothetical protein